MGKLHKECTEWQRSKEGEVHCVMLCSHETVFMLLFLVVTEAVSQITPPCIHSLFISGCQTFIKHVYKAVSQVALSV